ncbi:hypothetical protein ECANGB1_2041 [Enterospora canceri]|uniref:Uncharacterized protein n=1 Tax=Enterospora canceri TaxID=1081671 RepID=A0A1Y1S559_9MICR|nr:hypothetical protein ECANGB1_2041 [Enterospora canceri]
MTFLDSVHHCVTGHFYGTEMLVLPSHVTYLLYSCVTKIHAIDLGLFLKILNTFLLSLFVCLLTSMHKTGIKRVIGSTLLVASFIPELKGSFLVDNRLFGAICLLWFLRCQSIPSAACATLMDLHNLPFVIYHFLTVFITNFYHNYLRRKSNTGNVIQFVWKIIAILISWFLVAFIDFKLIRSEYSTSTYKYDIGIRNNYVINKTTDDDPNGLFTTHRFIMDRSVVDLINSRHKNVYEGIIFEKVHDTVDIGEEERFIRYNDTIKIHKKEGGKVIYLKYGDTNDTTFNFTDWTDADLTDENSLYTVQDPEDPNSKEYFESRKVFNIVHKDSDQKMCTKFDQKIYFSGRARKASCEYVAQTNENHPYYIRHFVMDKARETKLHYQKNRLNLLIYFKFIRKHGGIPIGQQVIVFTCVFVLLYFILMILITIREHFFDGILSVEFAGAVVALVAMAAFGCNFYSFVVVYYGFILEFSGAIQKALKGDSHSNRDSDVEMATTNKKNK